MNVFELVAKLTMDTSGYDKGLKDSEKKAGGAKGKIGGALKATGVAAAAGVGAAAVAVGKLTKVAVQGYSDNEQLVGGVKKLYGNAGMSLQKYAKANDTTADKIKSKWDRNNKAQALVMKNANNAYKSSGMSANQYMETATQFSASLISSLKGNTVEAAKQTDVAMKAISDNVNTFGSNAEDVTNAFKGFSKQNYTMLDNLKLGYGGTKTEMERLIKDANAWGKANGEASNLSINSFSDVVTAIQQIQEKQQVAGTTAREAGSTVEGSLNMLRTSWQNLMDGIANPDADMGQLIDNVVSSAKTAFSNLFPVIKQALTGLGEFITQVAPLIAKELPGMIETLAPPLISATGSLIAALVAALPGLIQSLIEQLPTIASQIWTAFVQSFQAASPSGKVGMAAILGTTVIGAFSKVSDIVSKLDLASKLGGGEGGGFGLGKIAKSAAASVKKVVPMIISGVGTVGKSLVALATGPVGIIVLAIAGAVTAGILIYRNWDKIKKKAGELGAKIAEVWNAIKSATITVWNAVKGVILTVWNGIKTVVMTYVNAVKTVIVTAWNVIKKVTTTIWKAIKVVIVNPIKSAAKVVIAIAKTIKAGVVAVFRGAKTAIRAVWNGVKAVITAPIRGALVVINFVKRIKNGVVDTFSAAVSKVKAVWGKITDTIGKPFKKAAEVVQKVSDTIKKIFPLKIGKIFSDLKIPKIGVSGGKAPFGIGGKGKLPKFDVSWGAKGGIIDGAQLIGAGEAGKEALIPLERNTGWMDTLAQKTSKAMGANKPTTMTFNVTMNVSGADSPEEWGNRLVSELRRQARMGIA